MGHMVFRGDDRAQVIQIGAVLLFGLLIVSFSIYQAYVVPNQNREIEFDHFTGAQDDMAEFRNGVVRAGQTGSSAPVGVQLGTTYPARLAASQPPGSSGTLRTDPIGGGGNEFVLENTGADMADICGLDVPTTRATIYRPAYNYLEGAGNVTYENTVTYTGGQGGQSIQAGQQLVADTTIQVYPLVGSYDRGGSDVATVTLRGGETGENASVPGGFSLHLPTDLSASTWADLLDDQPNVESVADVAGRRAINITFADGENYEVRCSPVGVETAPDNEPTVVAADGTAINPNAGTDVVLRGTDESGDSSLTDNQVRLELENTDPNEYQNITRLRFPLFVAESGTELPDSFEQGGTVVERLGPLTAVGPITFSPQGTADDTKTVVLDVYCGKDGSASASYDLASGDVVVATAAFDDGTSRTYFVTLDSSGSTPGNRCGGGGGGVGGVGGGNGPGRGN